MMPTATAMSHTIPGHVLRVGQTICVDSSPEMSVPQQPSHTNPSVGQSDADLDISLDNLNQLILELDPTFEPILTNTSPPCIISPTADCCSDDDAAGCMLVPRGCTSPSVSPLLTPSIPIPTHRCSPNGSLAFSGSPNPSRPPLPCGSVPRQIPSPRNEASLQGGLWMPSPNRNSAVSLLSMSPGSDTSYMLGSSLSLASEDAESPESFINYKSGSLSDVSPTKSCDAKLSPDKPLPLKLPLLGHQQLLHSTGAHSSPASLAGSLTDIPVVLINGTPQQDRQIPHFNPPESDLMKMSPKPFPSHSFRAHFNGSQPSMKFIMDTSKFWFRPHINRAEADALVKNQEPGTFVVRDSTSYKGSFGLVMKVDQAPSNLSGCSRPEESGLELVRHFLIESSAKGVRIKGSSHEPYFGSLSALVYQHTISPYALPCKLRLQCQDLDGGEERAKAKEASEDKAKTACNFLYLNAVSTEMLTGPCAVQRAVTSTLEGGSGAFAPTVVNLKASMKGVTLTDIHRKLFFRRHYPAHLLSYSGEDPDNRLWVKGGGFAARMFGFVAKGVEAGTENVCHVFAEYDPLQPCSKAIKFITAAVPKL